MDVSQFLIDFLFYSVVEGMMYLYIRDTMMKNKDYNFKSNIFYGIIISFCVCISSYSISDRYVNCGVNILILFVFFIVVFRDSLKDAFYNSSVCILYIFIIELIIIQVLNQYDFYILTLSLGSFYRFFVFLVAKLIEFSGIYCWRKRINESSNRNRNS